MIRSRVARRVVIDVGFFEGRVHGGLQRPGDGRAAFGLWTVQRWEDDVRIFDPLAGGEALLVLDFGRQVGGSLAVFKDPATGKLRLACGC